MKIETSELTGVALDWAVAKCEHPGLKWGDTAGLHHASRQLVIPAWPEPNCYYAPSINWEQGGPIIERELIQINPSISSSAWGACNPSKGQCVWVWADTPLIAAMRCYVASKLGAEVNIPEELTK